MNNCKVINKEFGKYILTFKGKKFASLKITESDFRVVKKRDYISSEEEEKFLIDFLIEQGFKDKVEEQLTESKLLVTKKIQELQRELRFANLGLGRIDNNNKQKTLI